MKTWKYAGAACAAYAGFIGAWAVLTLPGGADGGVIRFAAEMMFFLIGAGVAGILLPVLIARKMEYPFNEPSTGAETGIGIGLCALAVAIEVAVFQSWFTILTANPDDPTRMKYAFTSLSIALSVSVFSFVLGPRLFTGKPGGSWKSVPATILLPALSLGVLMYLFSGLDDPRLPLVMAAVGALAGAGHAFSKKFFLSFLTLFLAVHANTLSADLYRGIGWPFAAAGLLFTVAALVISWMEDRSLPRSA